MKLSNFYMQHHIGNRHSGAGRNPGKVHAPLGCLNASFLKFYPDWIPAYAGMTEVGL